MVHPAVELNWNPKLGHFLQVNRALPRPFTALLSIPSTSFVTADYHHGDVLDESNRVAFSSPIFELAHKFARGIADVHSDHHPYLSFVYDSYNVDASLGDASGEETERSDEEMSAVMNVIGNWDDHPSKSNNGSSDLQNEGTADEETQRKSATTEVLRNRSQVLNKRQTISSKFLEELEDLHNASTALNAEGVDNAPFLDSKEFTTLKYRGEGVRLQRFLREFSQSLPYFACSSARWAVSMALSRSLVDPRRSRRLVAPLVDFVSHSATPNCDLVFEDEHCIVGGPLSTAVRVRGYGSSGASRHGGLHLVSGANPIGAGTILTIQYANEAEDNFDYWRYWYGFSKSIL